jgi:prepilin-type N-terminal cleavage/methylation domain-containing protein
MNVIRRPCTLSPGFTLVELSVVLVIIGLLIGAILLGRDMIRAAELRKVVSQFQQFQTAVNMFYDQYRGLPGDLKNATNFYPTDTPGNGDGYIDDTAAGGIPEERKDWQHLSLAGFVGGGYSGDLDGSGNWVLGQTGPPAPISGGGYWIGYPCGAPTGCAPTGVFNRAGHFIQLGRASGGTCIASLLTPQDAFYLDTKLDNGIASSGKLMGMNGFPAPATNCTTSVGVPADYSVPAGSVDYNLTNTGIACRIMYWLD